MIRIAYVSRVDSDFGDTHLGNILTASRVRNQRDQITGMLVYHDDSVLQILEGPEEKVMACYERICEDPRHSHIEAMDRRSVGTRSFSDWSMGLAEPQNFRTMPGASLHSLDEIRARLKDVEGLDLPAEKLRVISTLRRFMSRVNLKELAKGARVSSP